MSGVREHKKARTRSSILRAGGELFRQHGFDETSVDEIARASSVSRQTFFNYFEGKDALLAELGHEWLRQQAIAPREGALNAQAGPVLDAMRSAIAKQADAIESDRAFVILVVTRSNLFSPQRGSRGRRSSREHVAVIFEAVANIIRAGQAGGEIATDIDPLTAAELLVSSMFMTLRLWACGYWGFEVSLEDRMLAALRVIEHGLRSQSET